MAKKCDSFRSKPFGRLIKIWYSKLLFVVQNNSIAPRKKTFVVQWSRGEQWVKEKEKITATTSFHHVTVRCDYIHVVISYSVGNQNCSCLYNIGLHSILKPIEMYCHVMNEQKKHHRLIIICVSIYAHLLITNRRILHVSSICAGTVNFYLWRIEKQRKKKIIYQAPIIIAHLIDREWNNFKQFWSATTFYWNKKKLKTTKTYRHRKIWAKSMLKKASSIFHRASIWKDLEKLGEVKWIWSIGHNWWQPQTIKLRQKSCGCIWIILKNKLNEFAKSNLDYPVFLHQIVCKML